MYGDNGKGYAIGLSRASFDSTIITENFLETIQYVDATKKQPLSGEETEPTVVSQIPTVIQEEVTRIISEISPSAEYTMGQANWKLLRLALLIKHSAFANEREVRLLIQGAPPMFSTPSNGVFVPRRVLWLVNSNLPGGEANDEKNTLIRAIKIGPALDQGLAEHGLKSFLKMHVSNDVRIDRSVAPFRSAL